MSIFEHTCTATHTFPWNESYIKNYYFYGSHWVERFRWLSLCWVQIRPFLCLIHADGPKITPQWLPYCITMPKCMYNCIMSAHIYKRTHSNTLTVPHRMSEAPVSVLNCNGPCQIKGKGFFFYVLRQTQLIFHQPWIHRPHWTTANSSALVCAQMGVCVYTCVRGCISEHVDM